MAALPCLGMPWAAECDSGTLITFRSLFAGPPPARPAHPRTGVVRGRPRSLSFTRRRPMNRVGIDDIGFYGGPLTISYDAIARTRGLSEKGQAAAQFTRRSVVPPFEDPV